MLTLCLFRHAKSSWDVPGMKDFDRPLNERGRASAPAMGRFMAAHGTRPDRIVSSPSQRTRETLDLVVPALGPPPPPVRFEDMLYLASPEKLLAVVRATDAGIKTLMLVGHNPGLHDLALELIGSGPKDARVSLAEKLPTAGLVVIDFATDDWRMIKPDEGRLATFMSPRRLDAAAPPRA